MNRKKTIRLTESEFKNIIKESVKYIIENYNRNDILKESETFDVDLSDIDSSSYPELDEFLQDAKMPDTIKVDMDFDIDYGDEGDYWTAPTGSSCRLIDYHIDSYGDFKQYVPEELYNEFIECVGDSIERNSSYYEEEVLERSAYDAGDHADYEYDSRCDY
jgi:hypothetical protein